MLNTTNPLLNLVFQLLLMGLVVYLVYWLVNQPALPAPVTMVIKVIVALVVIFWLLGLLGILV